MKRNDTKQKEKEERIKRKKRLEKKWEMLRWLVKYIEKNKEKLRDVLQERKETIFCE